MRVWVVAGCVTVLVSLGSGFKIPDFISDLVDGKDNKRQDAFPGIVEDLLPASFAFTFVTSLALRFIEIATTATQGKYEHCSELKTPLHKPFDIMIS